MNDNEKSMSQRIAEHTEWLKTPEGKASMEESWKKIEARLDRNKYWATRIAGYIGSLSDEELKTQLYRFLAWENKYEERWYKMYIQTDTMLFNRVIEAFEMLGEDFEEEDFFAGGHIYKNYIFKCYQGQECIYRVLDISKPIKDELIFQSK